MVSCKLERLDCSGPTTSSALFSWLTRFEQRLHGREPNLPFLFPDSGAFLDELLADHLVAQDSLARIRIPAPHVSTSIPGPFEMLYQPAIGDVGYAQITVWLQLSNLGYLPPQAPD